MGSALRDCCGIITRARSVTSAPRRERRVHWRTSQCAACGRCCAPRLVALSGPASLSATTAARLERVGSWVEHERDCIHRPRQRAGEHAARARPPLTRRARDADAQTQCVHSSYNHDPGASCGVSGSVGSGSTHPRHGARRLANNAPGHDQSCCGCAPIRDGSGGPRRSTE